MHTYIRAYMHTYVHAYIHRYIDTNKHTYIALHYITFTFTFRFTFTLHCVTFTVHYIALPSQYIALHYITYIYTYDNRSQLCCRELPHGCAILAKEHRFASAKMATGVLLSPHLC